MTARPFPRSLITRVLSPCDGSTRHQFTAAAASVGIQRWSRNLDVVAVVVRGRKSRNQITDQVVVVSYRLVSSTSRNNDPSHRLAFTSTARPGSIDRFCRKTLPPGSRRYESLSRARSKMVLLEKSKVSVSHEPTRPPSVSRAETTGHVLTKLFPVPFYIVIRVNTTRFV